MSQDSSETSLSKNAPQGANYPPIEVIHQDSEIGMEIVRYSNGSHSIRDVSCQQNMHSRVGPEEESRIVYAESAKVSERLKRFPTLTLWDVGMGTGANVTATLDEIVRNGATAPDQVLRVESFEYKPCGLALALRHLECFPSLQKWATPLQQLLDQGQVELEVGTQGSPLKVQWRLWTGDFYSQMQNASVADLIYFDFYSPKAHTPLWTKERFRAIREVLGSHDTELFTYSAATPTRLAMLLGGFFVGYGARTVMKTETTIAATRLELLEHPLDEKWRAKLDLSTSIEDHADRAAGHKHPQWRASSTE